MKEYHKIKTVFARDPETKHKTLLDGKWACDEFSYLANNEWEFTEKVDGTNIRIQFDEDIKFSGKTDNASIPAILVNRLNEIFLPKLELLKGIFDEPTCLYGEGYGAKIQKGGGNYRANQDFVLFDVRIGEWWLQRADIEDIGEKLGLDVVPIVGHGTLHDMIYIVQDKFYSHWGDFFAEGIVARPRTELVTRSGKRIITKLKLKDFK